jgi:hypothetical protein
MNHRERREKDPYLVLCGLCDLCGERNGRIDMEVRG